MSVSRLLVCLLLCSMAWSAESTLTVEAPWARATAPSAANGAVFLTLINSGDAEVRITAAASSASSTAELHGHRAVAGGMQMYQLDGLTVPAKGKVELAPGGLHVMLFGLTAPLKEGTSITLDLTVAGAASPLHVVVPVLGIAAMAPDCCTGKTP